MPNLRRVATGVCREVYLPLLFLADDAQGYNGDQTIDGVPIRDLVWFDKELA